jgi:hypothetical protein
MTPRGTMAVISRDLAIETAATDTGMSVAWAWISKLGGD